MAGVADNLCHLMEQYFTPEANAKVQDRMNEGVMHLVFKLMTLERTPLKTNVILTCKCK
jgi:alcohol dehydrogenase YqhD (iron-dependent ADH family)